MAAPVLLVADDLSLIASVKRVLAREGRECVLATSAADAIIAFGHALPGLLVLQPSVESDRGGVVLEELQQHPDAQLLKVLLLGETIPGFAFPVEPLPIDPEHFATSLSENMRASESSSWEVREASADPSPSTPTPPPAAHELEPWRATHVVSTDTPTVDPDVEVPEPVAVADPDPTPPPDVPPFSSGPSAATLARNLFGDLEPPPDVQPDASPPEPTAPAPSPNRPAFISGPSVATLERNLFGDLPALEDQLHRDIEAEALASVESNLAQEQDDELRRLEDEVRAEAQRRREARAAASAPVVASPPPATTLTDGSGEHSFADLSSQPPTPPEPDRSHPGGWLPTPAPTSRAQETLGRAEQMLLESRAVADAHRRADDADERRAQAELEAMGRRAEHAESLVRREREVRAQLETELEHARIERDALQEGRAQLAEHLAAEQHAHQALAEQLSQAAGAVHAQEEQLADLARRRDERITELTRAREERLAELNRQQGEAISALTRRHDEQQARLRAELEEAQAAAQLARADADAALEAQAGLELERTRAASLQAALDQAREALAAAQQEATRQAAEAVQLEPERVAHDATRAALAQVTATLEASQQEATRQAAEAVQLQPERAAHEATRRALADATATREEAQLEVTRLQAEAAQLERERVAHDDTRRALNEATAALDLARAQNAELAAETAQLEAERTAHDATRRALAEAEAQQHTLTSENTLVEEARTEAELARQAADEAKARAEVEGAELRQKLAALERQLASLTELLEEATLQRQRVERELGQAGSSLTEARAAIALQEADKAALRDELERAQGRLATTVRDFAQLKDSLDLTRTRAEQAEATASLAGEKVRELEARDTMPLSLPGRRALGVARHGQVDLDGLARLFCQLVLANADLRVELGAAGGTRTLWLKKGHIVAAESSFDAEGLIDRARRDGLIDGRQEAELRMLRTATLREQLGALKARGLIRDVEAVPLVQRCAEQVALEALAEESTQYRLSDEPPGPDVTQVTMPRATLPLLAEALRRAVPADALLEKLGGGEAVPVPTDAEWDLRSLGFSDRERKMLTWADGEATVEDVTLASGLKSEVAFRALLVARLLGVIELKAPAVRAPVIDADLEVKRLEAKFDQVQDADYFTVLGLDRGAGQDDVARAWKRLSNEFHPLRFSGHPDAGLQQRAQVVYGLLEEAARALEDDRRRAEYARHLLD